MDHESIAVSAVIRRSTARGKYYLLLAVVFEPFFAEDKIGQHPKGDSRLRHDRSQARNHIARISEERFIVKLAYNNCARTLACTNQRTSGTWHTV